MEELLDEVWAKAKMIRIYTKPKGQIPDYGAPVVLHAEHPSIEYFCNKLHKGILSQFKYAWVWGSSVRPQPQKCGKDHILHDEDVIQIIKKIWWNSHETIPFISISDEMKNDNEI